MSGVGIGGRGVECGGVHDVRAGELVVMMVVVRGDKGVELGGRGGSLYSGCLSVDRSGGG